MNDMARIITTAAGQAVELPEGYRFDGAEVRVWRDGDRVVLEAAGEVDVETGLPVDRLRQLIEEGLASGPGEPWDAEAIKRAGRAALAERRP